MYAWLQNRFSVLRHPFVLRVVRDYVAFIPVAFAVLVNIIVWTICLIILIPYPSLLGPAVLSATYGLRHALDADHISAIDNLTRRLVADGQRPVSVGLWFSLGHSSVVIMTCFIIAVTSASLADKFGNFQAIGGIIGTSISMSFLLLIGVANCFVLYRLIKSMRYELAVRKKTLDTLHDQSPEEPIVPPTTVKANGILFRLFSRLFRLIDRPIKMYPLGILFGLGFDTSTEIALLGIASLQGSKGTPIFLIMIFPALFTAGMLLIDTIDGAGMYLAYTSNVFRENRIGRLFYAILLTAMSVFVALTIGLIQMLTLVLNTTRKPLTGSFWRGVASVGDRYDVIGGSIVAAFVSVVVLSGLVHWWLIRTRPERFRSRVADNNPSAVLLVGNEVTHETSVMHEGGIDGGDDGHNPEAQTKSKTTVSTSQSREL